MWNKRLILPWETQKKNNDIIKPRFDTLFLDPVLAELSKTDVTVPLAYLLEKSPVLRNSFNDWINSFVKKRTTPVNKNLQIQTPRMMTMVPNFEARTLLDGGASANVFSKQFIYALRLSYSPASDMDLVERICGH